MTLTHPLDACHRMSYTILVPLKKKAMLGMLNTHEIESVIHQQLIARLGCYADGKVYVVPVSYAYDGEFIYAISGDGMKVNMMRKNPSVCLQIDDMQNMSSWQSVIIWGEFEELTKAEDRNIALRILMSRIVPNFSSELIRISPQWPFPDEHPEAIKGVVYRIRISEKSGRFEKMLAEEYFASF
jgi:nitroimidazol reductase NimA-like FMN-containing flavoprotein (pyridoxamine 5'-phosphate oxidase superfamily)